MAGAEGSVPGSVTLGCVVCGTVFSYEKAGSGRLRRFCSARCGQIRRNQQGQGYRRVAPAKPVQANITGTCVVCGEAFRTSNARTRTCGKTCGMVLAHGTRSERSRARRTRACEQCGEAFVATEPEARFCSRACSANSIRLYRDKREAKAAQAVRARARRSLPPIPESARCRVCATEFRPHTVKNTLCRSEECRRADACRRSAEAYLSTRAAPAPRKCPECETIFSPNSDRGSPVYCSISCARRSGKRQRKLMERATLHGARREPVNPFKVFRRDGWRCHLCGAATRQDKRGTYHPKAPELDHIVPLSRGGDHSYANTACACRQCNGRKGATTKGQPSLLMP